MRERELGGKGEMVGGTQRKTERKERRLDNARHNSRSFFVWSPKDHHPRFVID